MITSFDDLLDRMRQGPRVTVAVAAADDEAALGAVAAAHELGIAEALLFGDGARISAVYKEMTGSPDLPFEIREAAEEQAARTAVAAVRSGAAQILLKGKIKTAALLKAVLDSEHGLRSSRQLSDLFIFEDPSRAGNKLVMITDGGVTLKPDLKQKIEITINDIQQLQSNIKKMTDRMQLQQDKVELLHNKIRFILSFSLSSALLAGVILVVTIMRGI